MKKLFLFFCIAATIKANGQTQADRDNLARLVLQSLQDGKYEKVTQVTPSFSELLERAKKQNTQPLLSRLQEFRKEEGGLAALDQGYRKMLTNGLDELHKNIQPTIGKGWEYVGTELELVDWGLKGWEHTNNAYVFYKSVKDKKTYCVLLYEADATGKLFIVGAEPYVVSASTRNQAIAAFEKLLPKDDSESTTTAVDAADVPAYTPSGGVEDSAMPVKPVK